MDILQLEQMVRRQGEHFVLGPIDIRLDPGEVLGVMGPDGAGKTTLLRLLWGFLRPHEGSVSVFGRAPHLEQVWIRMQAGYMPESPNLYDSMTGIRFLEFMAGFYPAWDWERAYQLVNLFDLEVERTIGALSGGDRAKLGLVAAVTHRPRLLVLDEPTSGLDPIVRSEFLRSLRQVAAEDETGVVLSSDICDDLERTADTILMLDHGSVVEYASTGVLLERYSQTRLEEAFLHATGQIRAATQG